MLKEAPGAVFDTDSAENALVLPDRWLAWARR